MPALLSVAETPEYLRRAERLLSSTERPIYLLTIFGKNEKADLSGAERKELAALVRLLKTK